MDSNDHNDGIDSLLLKDNFPPLQGTTYAKNPFMPQLEELSRRGKFCDFNAGHPKRDVKYSNLDTDGGLEGSDPSHVTARSGFAAAYGVGVLSLSSSAGYGGSILLGSRGQAAQAMRKKRGALRETAAAFKEKQMNEHELFWGKKQRHHQRRMRLMQQQRQDRFTIRARVFAEWAMPEDPAWTLTADWPLSDLSKLELAVSMPMKEIGIYGKIPIYNKKFDQKTPKTKCFIPVGTNISTFSCTASQDSKLQELADSQPKDDVSFLVTDEVLSSLMAASSSRFAFHFRIFKKGNVYYMDKNETPSALTIPTVNEFSSDIAFIEASNSPETNPNFMQLYGHAAGIKSGNALSRAMSLGIEALHISKAVRQCIMIKEGNNIKTQKSSDFPSILPCDKKNIAIQDPNKYPEMGGVRYSETSFKFIKGDLNKVVHIIYRSDVAAVQEINPNSFTNVFVATLTEAPSYAPVGSAAAIQAGNSVSMKVVDSHSWGNSMENQVGSFIMGEMKLNMGKMRKYLASAMLADCKKLKLVFANRRMPLQPDSHAIQLVRSYETEFLAKQLDFNLSNAWAIVKHVISEVLEHSTADEEEFIVCRDVSNPQLKLFKVGKEFEQEIDE